MAIERTSLPSPERIVNAAMLHKGQIYTGKSHVLAMEQAEKQGIPGEDLFLHGTDGFLTSTGRFVDRRQAVDIARQADQLKYNAPGILAALRRAGMSKEALKNKTLGALAAQDQYRE
jgi:hypothetical protein